MYLREVQFWSFIARIWKHSLERLCFFMFKKDKKNWKLYLFYNGILIKKLRINENDEINGKPLCLLIVGHKEIFKKWIVRVMVTPICLLHNDEVKKITYWGVIDEKGVVVK